MGFDGRWLPPDQDPRLQMEPTRGEKECLVGYLDHYCGTLALESDGLDAQQLATKAVPPSNISLLGLARPRSTPATAGTPTSRDCIDGHTGQ